MKRIILALYLSLFAINSIAAEIQPIVKKVYISKVIDHPALNETVRGIIDYLAENNYIQEKNLDLRIISAQGSAVLASQIATKFISQKPDLVVGIGTISAQSLARSAINGDTKLIFSSITDPLSSNLIKSSNILEKNITGVSNFVELEPQIQLFKMIQPNLKNLGIIYNPGESNSFSIVKKLEALCPKLGIKLIKQAAGKTSEVHQAIINLAAKVDAIFINNDNTALSALRTIINIANQSKIPVYVSDTDTINLGALVAMGPNQYEIGRQTGKLILQVLNGEEISQIQVQFPSKSDLYINLDAAAKLGINIPDNVKNQATKIIEKK